MDSKSGFEMFKELAIGLLMILGGLWLLWTGFKFFFGNPLDFQECSQTDESTIECRYLIKRWRGDEIIKVEDNHTKIYDKETGDLLREEY
ncbi:MAG: hypothetical protein ABH833_04635 [Parcubacteria group bacterium]